MKVVFRASRWNRHSPESRVQSPESGGQSPESMRKTCGTDDGEGDYLNCPMNARRSIRAFYAALVDG